MPPGSGAVDETSAVAGPAGGRGGPANLVVLLLDSLNRHMLGCYGGTEFETPNLDRFAAERAVRFTSHVTGSLPCMPARHDILCGSLDFLWRPWGSIEVWEEPITAQLRRAGVTTMLVSDHPHLFETGGENYHTDFSAWDYVRGHEGDPWRTYSDPTYIGAPALPARGGGWFWRDRLGWAGALDRPYDRSRTFFRAEEDFPGPKTMRTAAGWLRDGAPGDAPFLLFVDEFDPHEPFDTPAPWAGRYDPGWEGELLIWPPYDIGAVGSGRLSEREGQQLRANYGAKLSMIDHWVGEVFSALTERGLWDSTAVIVCTDHGHYLGEKDIWGKPGVMQYETLGHIPLLMSWPGSGGGTECGALTTNVDLHATIADVFGVAGRVVGGGTGAGGGAGAGAGAGAGHGVSLLPLVRGEAASVREWAVGGVYGNWVQVTDGRHKYARGAAGTNFPLSMWSNRWSTMPVHGLEDTVRLPPPDRRARLDFMPGSEVPVIRQPFEPGDRLPYWVGGNVVDRHFLFDLDSDPGEDENLVGTQTEADLVELLRVALAAVEAPAEQLERLGIA
jgi:arylsulfatase A-like enzyme